MGGNLSFSYDDLISKAEGIRGFTSTFTTQLNELAQTANELSSNYQSEDATKVINAINTVEEHGEDFKEAIRKFADVISEEIAPTYRKIEEETREATTSNIA
jgi:cytochrome c556